MKTSARIVFSALLCASILLNIFDIALHIAITQPEILRIAGNVLIIIASSIALSKQYPRRVLTVGLASYLVLNGTFIALNGIGNAGIVFIALSTVFVLTPLLVYKK